MSFDLKIVSGDLSIENGQLATITGTAKLEQDLLKIALTEVGSDPMQPWYGSLVGRSLIGNLLPSDILLSTAKTQLQTAIENLKTLQNLQVSSGQRTSPDEMIATIKNISIFKNPSDPTAMTVLISVYSRAFGQVNATFEVSPNG